VLNARDSMSGGGRVIVATRETWLDEFEASRHSGAKPGGYVALSVTDTGCGMGPEVLGHLFEPFFTTKPHGEGTGLGLASVHGIVKGAGGHTVVRSEVGIGSTFELRFPRARPRDSLAVANPPAVPARSTQGGGETILVVEDEGGVRRLVATILRKAGYEAWSAQDGEEAIRIVLAQRDRIALLLSDIVMPKMNGRALAARVLQIRPDMRVLLMSGYDEATKEWGNPPFPVIEKPFTEQVLLAHVRGMLDRHRDPLLRAGQGIVPVAPR
jgi:two-component system, cell cycle sensor histidine kinase and response regulator CckA